MYKSIYVIIAIFGVFSAVFSSGSTNLNALPYESKIYVDPSNIFLMKEGIFISNNDQLIRVEFIA